MDWMGTWITCCNNFVGKSAIKAEPKYNGPYDYAEVTLDINTEINILMWENEHCYHNGIVYTRQRKNYLYDTGEMRIYNVYELLTSNKTTFQYVPFLQEAAEIVFL